MYDILVPYGTRSVNTGQRIYVLGQNLDTKLGLRDPSEITVSFLWIHSCSISKFGLFRIGERQ